MGQTLAAEIEQHPQRAAARRIARRGDPLTPVRTVALRRAERPPGMAPAGTSERDWRHRWLVSGHWRRQYYPSVDEHRPLVHHRPLGRRPRGRLAAPFPAGNEPPFRGPAAYRPSARRRIGRSRPGAAEPGVRYAGLTLLAVSPRDTPAAADAGGGEHGQVERPAHRACRPAGRWPPG
jgi:hypothetical protein